MDKASLRKGGIIPLASWHKESDTAQAMEHLFLGTSDHFPGEGRSTLLIIISIIQLKHGRHRFWN